MEAIFAKTSQKNLKSGPTTKILSISENWISSIVNKLDSI